MAVGPHITAFFDEATNTVSYLVSDPGTGGGGHRPGARFRPGQRLVGTRSAEKIFAARTSRVVQSASSWNASARRPSDSGSILRTGPAQGWHWVRICAVPQLWSEIRRR